MGREVRKVPADWHHPTSAEGNFIPLHEGSADQHIAMWDEGAKMWAKGLRDDYSGGWKPVDDDMKSMSYAEWAGGRPDPADYMGDFPESAATHFMMYEDTSEGTPISPSFQTPEDLAKWLADTGASAFGNMTADYEHWLRVARGGFAPSMIISNGRMMSGVEALSDDNT